MPVLDEEAGESLEYLQLWHHTRYKNYWEESYYNELRRLFQVIGIGGKGIKKQRVAQTEDLRVIRYEDVPLDR